MLRALSSRMNRFYLSLQIVLNWFSLKIVQNATQVYYFRALYIVQVYLFVPLRM